MLLIIKFQVKEIIILLLQKFVVQMLFNIVYHAQVFEVHNASLYIKQLMMIIIEFQVNNNKLKDKFHFINSLY